MGHSDRRADKKQVFEIDSLDKGKGSSFYFFPLQSNLHIQEGRKDNQKLLPEESSKPEAKLAFPVGNK